MNMNELIKTNVQLISQYRERLLDLGIKSIFKHLTIAGTTDNSFNYSFTGTFETDNNIFEFNNQLKYCDGSNTTPQLNRYTRIFICEKSDSIQKRLWVCNENGDTMTPVTGDNYSSLTRNPNFTFWIY